MFRRLIQRNFNVIYFHIKHYGLSVTEQSYMPETITQQKILKVAVIGTPNAGKSTFINYLMDRKVCPTSSKVHTTRTKSKAIFTLNDSQIVFLDTPGLINEREQKKHKLEKTFLRDSKSSLKEADIIGVIHDVSNIWTRDKLDIKVIRLLEKHVDIPSFLVLNKVDLLKSKRKLLDITRQVTGNFLNGKPVPNSKLLKQSDEIKSWTNFKDVFMVSSLNGNGLDEIKNYLIDNAYPGKWMFPAETWSDQSLESIFLNTVKATLLDFLPQEIPYTLKPIIELLENNEDNIKSVILIECPTERISKLIAGVSDGRLRQITEVAQRDLQDAFHKHIRIKLVLVPKSKN